MERWVRLLIEKSRDEMVTALQENIVGVPIESPETTYGLSAIRLCQTHWAKLFQSFNAVKTVETTDPRWCPEDQYENLRNINATLRRQLKEQNKIAREVYGILLGPSAGSTRTLDTIHAQLLTESQKVRDELFLLQHAAKDTEFDKEHFSLTDYFHLAEFKLNHAANQMLWNQSAGTSTIEFDMKLQQLTTEHQAKVSRLERQIEQERQALRTLARSSRLELEEAQSAAASILERTKRLHSEELQRLKEGNDETIKALIEENDTTLQELQHHFASRIASMKTSDAESRAEALADIRKALDEAKRSKADKDDLAGAARRALAKKAAAAAENADGFQAYAEDDVDPHALWEGETKETLALMLQGRRAELEMLLSSHSIQTRAHTLEWESALRDVVARYEKEIQNLQQKLDADKSKIEALERSIEAKSSESDGLKKLLVSERENFEERLAAAQNEAEERIETQKNANQEIQAQLLATRKELKTVVETADLNIESYNQREIELSNTVRDLRAMVDSYRREWGTKEVQTDPINFIHEMMNAKGRGDVPYDRNMNHPSPSSSSVQGGPGNRAVNRPGLKSADTQSSIPTTPSAHTLGTPAEHSISDSEGTMSSRDPDLQSHISDSHMGDAAAGAGGEDSYVKPSQPLSAKKSKRPPRALQSPSKLDLNQRSVSPAKNHPSPSGKKPKVSNLAAAKKEDREKTDTMSKHSSDTGSAFLTQRSDGESDLEGQPMEPKKGSQDHDGAPDVSQIGSTGSGQHPGQEGELDSSDETGMGEDDTASPHGAGTRRGPKKEKHHKQPPHKDSKKTPRIAKAVVAEGSETVEVVEFGAEGPSPSFSRRMFPNIHKGLRKRFESPTPGGQSSTAGKRSDNPLNEAMQKFAELQAQAAAQEQERSQTESSKALVAEGVGLSQRPGSGSSQGTGAGADPQSLPFPAVGEAIANHEVLQQEFGPPEDFTDVINAIKAAQSLQPSTLDLLPKTLTEAKFYELLGQMALLSEFAGSKPKEHSLLILVKRLKPLVPLSAYEKINSMQVRPIHPLDITAVLHYFQHQLIPSREVLDQHTSVRRPQQSAIPSPPPPGGKGSVPPPATHSSPSRGAVYRLYAKISDTVAIISSLARANNIPRSFDSVSWTDMELWVKAQKRGATRDAMSLATMGPAVPPFEVRQMTTHCIDLLELCRQMKLQLQSVPTEQPQPDLQPTKPPAMMIISHITNLTPEEYEKQRREKEQQAMMEQARASSSRGSARIHQHFVMSAEVNERSQRQHLRSQQAHRRKWGAALGMEDSGKPASARTHRTASEEMMALLLAPTGHSQQ